MSGGHPPVYLRDRSRRRTPRPRRVRLMAGDSIDLGDEGRTEGGFRFVSGWRYMPTTTRIRWTALFLIYTFFITAVIVFGLLQTRDIRRQNRLEAELDDALAQYDILAALAGNLTAAPNCTVDGNTTITSNFSSALFAVFLEGDPSARFQFNLTGIDGMNLIVWSIRDLSGTIAYLSDIRPVGSVFPDDEFLIVNVLDETKHMEFYAGNITTATTQELTVPDESGTIALLSDVPAQPTVFLDDVFAVQFNGDPSAEAMLDLSGITTGITRTLTIQDDSGIVACLANISFPQPPFADNVFAVFEDADPTSIMEFDCSLIATGTTHNLTVQDSDGTIAYLSDIPQVVEVLVNVTREFPAVGFEGVATLGALGDLWLIEISLCGSGGGGGDDGAGGGSGSGHTDFQIFEPSSKFTNFTCTVSAGGAAGTGGSSGEDGNVTTLVGNSAGEYFLSLAGYGGGGGEPATIGGAAGGAGGGNGGNANGTIPGVAGEEGGLEGGIGALVTGSETFTDGMMGAINFPWRAGGGGSGSTEGTPGTTSRAAAWNGAYATNSSVCDGSTGCGAASMFGPGGIGSATPDGSYCAGGGSNGAGGGGACLFRYYLR